MGFRKIILKKRKKLKKVLTNGSVFDKIIFADAPGKTFTAVQAHGLPEREDVEWTLITEQ